ncbi:MAG: hypothetical protein J6S58_08105 [Lentisphaeria bacterium]|nr:hypothetical protein [Lentisphaeria bacterium]
MQKFDILMKVLIGVLLAVVGFFVTQTYYSIKALEKDVVTIRLKLAEFEASRISRQEIKNLIAEYHHTHVCGRK